MQANQNTAVAAAIAPTIAVPPKHRNTASYYRRRSSSIDPIRARQMHQCCKRRVASNHKRGQPTCNGGQSSSQLRHIGPPISSATWLVREPRPSTEMVTFDELPSAWDCGRRLHLRGCRGGQYAGEQGRDGGMYMDGGGDIEVSHWYSSFEELLAVDGEADGEGVRFRISSAVTMAVALDRTWESSSTGKLRGGAFARRGH